MAIFSEFLNSFFYYFQSAFFSVAGLKIEYTKKKKSFSFFLFSYFPMFFYFILFFLGTKR